MRSDAGKNRFTHRSTHKEVLFMSESKRGGAQLARAVEKAYQAGQVAVEKLIPPEDGQ